MVHTCTHTQVRLHMSAVYANNQFIEYLSRLVCMRACVRVGVRMGCCSFWEYGSP